MTRWQRPKRSWLVSKEVRSIANFLPTTPMLILINNVCMTLRVASHLSALPLTSNWSAKDCAVEWLRIATGQNFKRKPWKLAPTRCRTENSSNTLSPRSDIHGEFRRVDAFRTAAQRREVARATSATANEVKK